MPLHRPMMPADGWHRKSFGRPGISHFARRHTAVNLPLHGWVGRSPARREDPALLTGNARFIDALDPFPGTRHAAILRSPHAHARIMAIDTSHAERLPGVVCILTGTDVAAMSRPIATVLRDAPRGHCCAVDRVRYVGEPVAVVVAIDRYVAEDALDLIAVTYDILPAIAGIAAALAPDAEKLFDTGNIVHRRSFIYGEASSDAVAERVTINADHPRINATPIETYGVIAQFEAMPDQYTVWSNFQGPYVLQPVMSAALGVTGAQLRLHSPPASGGSFGIKQGVFAYIILIALASRKARVPVKWIEDRAEHLAASLASTGRQTGLTGEFAADGRLLSLHWQQVENVGAFLRPPEPSTLYRMHGALGGPYLVRHITVDNIVVVTNQLPAGLNRGYGGPQFVFPLERLMHEAARRLALDPAELRRRNLVPTDAFPITTISGQILDSGDYHGALDRLLQRADYTALQARRTAARAEGRLLGIGLAASIESSVSGMSYVNLALTPEERARAAPKSGAAATVRLSADPSGTISVWTGSTPNGQGHATVVAQVVADAIGVHPDDIRVVTEIDTGRDPWSITSGNYANRFSSIVLSAVAVAADRMARRIRSLAAAELGADASRIVLADGLASAPSVSNRVVPIARLCGATHWNSADLPADIAPGLVETTTLSPELVGPDPQDRVSTALTCGFMCDLALVEVARDTGRVNVLAYVAVHDVGRAMHPAIVRGQAEGGFAHGLGAALYECLAYDASGAFLSGSFAEYLCPTAMEMPPLTLDHVNARSRTTLLGTKGLGDGASMNAPAAICNAVADALQRIDLSLPLTPPRIWAMLRDLTPNSK